MFCWLIIGTAITDSSLKKKKKKTSQAFSFSFLSLSKNLPLQFPKKKKKNLPLQAHRPFQLPTINNKSKSLLFITKTQSLRSNSPKKKIVLFRCPDFNSVIEAMEG
ncbi:hypothetical protein RIF29_16004 [Crotalaria pallida]|uniref:Uncharacterized protein n=1 Tax=Crotalaria pallida TaxID=3830 RepID=A0AAN9FLK8_CROPI